MIRSHLLKRYLSLLTTIIVFTWLCLHNVIQVSHLYSSSQIQDTQNLTDVLVDTFKLRQERLEHICYKLWTNDEMTTTIKKVKKVYILNEAEIAYCPVFKAATTTTMRSLIDIWLKKKDREKLSTKLTTKEILSSIAPPYSKRINFIKFQNSTRSKTFVIVRHPFHRLVSAFRDKLERIHSTDLEEYKQDFYYKNFGRYMVRDYRAYARKTFGDKFFSEENYFGAPVKPKSLRRLELPTFWEFVQYIKRTSVYDMDEHWIPMGHYCSLCAIRYDYVIKYEHLTTEMPYVWDKIGVLKDISEVRWSLPEHTYRENERLTQIYFSLLSEEDVLDLYKIYKPDFDILGYNFNIGNLTFVPENINNKLI